VVVKVKEILAISEEAEQKFDVERFNLTELSVLEVRKQYQINRFAALLLTYLLHGAESFLGS